MPYTPPNSTSVTINFVGGGYTPPSGYQVTLEFSPPAADTLYPSGIAPGVIGTATVYNLTQYIPVAGISQFASGSPTVYNRTQYIGETGFSDFAAGTATIENHARLVAPGGINAGSFGTPQVDTDHFVYPAGLDATLFGTQFIDSSIRTIDVPNFQSALYGTPFVGYSERFIFAQGFFETRFGSPTMGRTLTLTPSGYDASLFGTAAVTDNTQHAYAVGLNAGGFGTHRISYYRQPVFAGGTETLMSGTPTVYNYRKYIRQIFEVTPYDGGVFGNFNDVANRNRIMGAIGFNAARLGNPHVDNAARPVLPAGLDATLYGPTMVAYAIRHVYPTGIESFPPGHYTAVLNSARVLAAQGADHAAFGRPSVESNLQTLSSVGRVAAGDFGLPFVAYRIRTVAPYYSYESPPPPSPDVKLGTRFLRPSGIQPKEVGAHVLEEHFTVFHPTGFKADRYGSEHYVYNVTPELRPNAYDQSIFGATHVFNRNNYYSIQGFSATLFGAQAVEHRERTLVPAGLNAFRTGDHALVMLADPGLPFPQTLAVETIGAGLEFGDATVTSNVLFPVGYTATLFGAATVRGNSIFPTGFFAAGTGQDAFGLPSLNGQQFIMLDAGPSGELGDIAPHRGIAAPDFPKQRVTPHTIWCTFDVTQQAIDNHEGISWALMDHALHPETARPTFGQAVVTNSIRQINQNGHANETLQMGTPIASNRVRTLQPDGIKSIRFGFPFLNGGGQITQHSASDFLTFGTASVDIVDTGQHFIRPNGFVPIGYGSPDVSNYIRTLTPAGFSENMGLPRVHPPEPLIPVGFRADVYGDASVSHYTRTLIPEGIEAPEIDYVEGYFIDRMHITRRNSLVVGAGAVGDMGLPIVSYRLRVITPTGIDESVVSVPHASRQNRILLGGYGFDASLFGDVDRWEAGKIKPHGDDMLLPGIPRMVNVVRPDGMVGTIGLASVSFSFGAQGFTEEVFGDATITHANNDHVCGTMVRAIPITGFGGAVFGTAMLS